MLFRGSERRVIEERGECGDVLCGIRPESLLSPEQVAPFFVTLRNSFFVRDTDLNY